MTKIPPQAKKVFSGEIFDVYQWPQIMFDGSTATFEMLKRADSVEIIAVSNKKILVLSQEQPMRDRFRSLAGGRCENNEAPTESAKRELLEETGYTSNDWELLLEDRPYNKIDWSNFVFIARNCSLVSKQNLDNGEKITVELYDFEQFVGIVRDSSIRMATGLRQLLWEALLDANKKTELRKKLGLNESP